MIAIKIIKGISESTKFMAFDTTAAVGNTNFATLTFLINSPLLTIDSTEYAKHWEKKVQGSNMLNRKIE